MSATKQHKVDGYVWCDLHGGVHDETTNPYDELKPSCRKRNHHALYTGADTQ